MGRSADAVGTSPFLWEREENYPTCRGIKRGEGARLFMHLKISGFFTLTPTSLCKGEGEKFLTGGGFEVRLS